MGRVGLDWVGLGWVGILKGHTDEIKKEADPTVISRHPFDKASLLFFFFFLFFTTFYSAVAGVTRRYVYFYWVQKNWRL